MQADPPPRLAGPYSIFTPHVLQRHNPITLVTVVGGIIEVHSLVRVGRRGLDELLDNCMRTACTQVFQCTCASTASNLEVVGWAV